MQLCYIDESGTPDVLGNTSHYVLAGISVPDQFCAESDLSDHLRASTNVPTMVGIAPNTSTETLISRNNPAPIIKIPTTTMTIPNKAIICLSVI